MTLNFAFIKSHYNIDVWAYELDINYVNLLNSFVFQIDFMIKSLILTKSYYLIINLNIFINHISF